MHTANEFYKTSEGLFFPCIRHPAILPSMHAVSSIEASSIFTLQLSLLTTHCWLHTLLTLLPSVSSLQSPVSTLHSPIRLSHYSGTGFYFCRSRIVRIVSRRIASYRIVSYVVRMFRKQRASYQENSITSTFTFAASLLNSSVYLLRINCSFT